MWWGRRRRLKCNLSWIASYDALYRDSIYHSHQYHRGVGKERMPESKPNRINTNAPNPKGRTIYPNNPERGNRTVHTWKSAARNQQVECL